MTVADYEALYPEASDAFIKKQMFVDAHLAAAETGAAALNVPVENILGLSALESGWGSPDGFARVNNFFGLSAPASFETGTEAARGNPNRQEAAFASYDNSLQSFIADYGDYVRGISDPTQFARALQNSGAFGINTNDGSNMPTYVSDLAGTINRLSPFIQRARQKQQ